MGARQVDEETIRRWISENSSPGSSSYLVYTALLTQTGTDAPVATELENTLGGTVVWVRNNLGDYTGTLAGVFTTNKTTAIIQNNYDALNTAIIYRNNADSVTVQTRTLTSPAGVITQTSADDILFETTIEIRVYP